VRPARESGSPPRRFDHGRSCAQGAKDMSGRFDMTPSPAFTTTTVAGAEKVTAFLRKVYGWMFVGLGITASVAFAVASSPALLQAIVTNRVLLIGLFVVEIGLVFF